MSDLGGFVGGMEAGQQYSQSRQLFQLTMAEGQQKLAEGEYKLREAPLDLKQKEIQVKTAEIALEQQQKMMELLKARGTGGGGTASPTDHASILAENVFSAADIAMQMGRPEEAAKLADKGTSILKNNAEIIKNQTAVQHKLYTDVADSLASVTESAQGWETAKANFITLHPDEARDPNIAKILQTPYHPGLIKAVRDSVVGLKDKSIIEKNQAQAADAYAQAKRAKFDTDVVLPQKVQESKAREERLIKSGHGNLVPKPTDINEIVKLAQRDLNIGSDNNVGMADLYDRSREIAATAKEYEAKGMTRAAAQDKAYTEARERGVYAGVEKNRGLALGSSASRPMPVPKSREQLKPGTWYATGSDKLPGGLGYFDGKQFLSVEDAPGKGSEAPGFSENIDEDDDE